jgi:hypothetical protein
VIERVGEEPVFERQLFLATLDRLEDYPEELTEPGRNFVLFLAVDGMDVPDAVLTAFARTVLEQGAAYVCVWGPGCEHVHDFFDAERGDRLVLTTWHDDETLDQALWFSLFVAFPDESLLAKGQAVLAVVVGHEDWAEQVRGRLSDPGTLHRDVAL